MKRYAALTLAALFALVLTGCAGEEPGRSLTAVGLDTCTGTVTDCFTRGDGEAFVAYIEVDTGDGAPLLFALPEGSTSGAAAEVVIGDKVRVESDSGDGDCRLVRTLEVTEHSPVLTEPPALTVSCEAGASVEAGKGTWSWNYREGRSSHAVESDAVSPLEWVELPALVLELARIPQDTPLRVHLRFDHAPDTVEAAYWNGDCRGQSDAESSELPVTFDEETGCFCIDLPDTNCIYEVHAHWEEQSYGGSAWYAFCTELPPYTP